ncbi:unnamed protein product [Linum trigynum]|uniref:Nodulin-like domain-containing protein n=1 Tax=Linum trigynum TaxID=586398 RepID=A0AAV2C7Z2_9ROSI
MSSSNPLPWLSLVAVIWLQAVIGTNTNFAAYSSQLKQYLSLSQLQLNSLAFASDAGKLFGWVSGVAAAHIPLWLVLMIGSSLGFVSYGLQFLSVANATTAASPSKTTSFLRSYPVMFLLNTLAGNSICWVNTVCYIVVTRNFPLDQQVAVGITTSYQGLTMKIYAVVVDELFASWSSAADRSYLLLDALFPLLVSALSLVLMASDFSASSSSPPPSGKAGSGGEVVQRCRRNGFLLLFVITTVTGVYAVLSSVSARLWSLFRYSGMVFTFGLLLAPLAVPATVYLKGKFVAWFQSSSGGYDVDLEEVKMNGGGESVVVTSKVEGKGVDHEEGGGGGPLLLVKEEVGVKEMVQRTEFWLYVFVYFLGPTIGIVYLNNLGQIAESRRCYQTSSLVSLSSSFTFFGRLLPSLLDYFFSRSKYLPPRPALLLLLTAPITAALFLLLNSSHAALYTSTAVIGICTGAITSIAVSITSELFGSRNFAVNHNVVVANIPVGSFCFGYLAAQVYESETLAGESKCMGMSCYRRTFLVWGQLSCFGVVLAFLLYNRTRVFYGKRLKALNSFLNH